MPATHKGPLAVLPAPPLPAHQGGQRATSTTPSAGSVAQSAAVIRFEQVQVSMPFIVAVWQQMSDPAVQLVAE